MSAPEPIPQGQTDFGRIAEAIAFIQANFRRQPLLEEVAAHVHLSPFHFQRLFTDWAGVSPKKFLRYLSLDYAKGLLKEPGATLFDAATQTGLSGTGRLHDLFVGIEGMTPGEWKEGGRALAIAYQFADTPFGAVLAASTQKGICHLAFAESEALGLSQLQNAFPAAVLSPQATSHHQAALRLFSRDWSDLRAVKLHLKGTPFQIRVWEALLRIPAGRLATYGAIAGSIGQANASRAVGSAIGSNPVAFLIPCHRVIQQSGAIGGFAWGPVRKSAMIGWEAVGADSE